jgi:hypothetical protein
MVSTLCIKSTLEDALGKAPATFGGKTEPGYLILVDSSRRIKAMTGILLANCAHPTFDQYHARFLPNLP